MQMMNDSSITISFSFSYTLKAGYIYSQFHNFEIYM